MANIDQKNIITATQDNQLIEACYTMTINEKRLLLLGISKVNPIPFPKESEPFRFSVTTEEWAKYYSDEKPWRAMKRAADTLLTRYVTLHPKTGITKKLSWFDEVEYRENEGVVFIRFGWSIQVRLAGMLEQFTKVNLLSVNKLTSLYSIRLYELLNQFRSTGYRIISVDDFRLAMDCVDSYSLIADLKKWVLKPAMKEINIKTDLRVKQEDLKRGRTIVQFRFVFSEEKQKDLFAEA